MLFFSNKQTNRQIVSCKMTAFFSFDLFMVYIPECKQKTMKQYTQIHNIALFKSGL